VHKPAKHFFVCRRHRDPAEGKPSCDTGGSGPIFEAVKKEIEARNLWDTVQLTATQCLGQCYDGPIAVVYPEGVWYGHLTVEDVPKLVEEHLIGGKPLKKKILG
jgi:(2Fe-2S) ferredoxin